MILCFTSEEVERRVRSRRLEHKGEGKEEEREEEEGGGRKESRMRKIKMIVKI